MVNWLTAVENDERRALAPGGQSPAPSRRGSSARQRHAGEKSSEALRAVPRHPCSFRSRGPHPLQRPRPPRPEGAPYPCLLQRCARWPRARMPRAAAATATAAATRTAKATRATAAAAAAKGAAAASTAAKTAAATPVGTAAVAAAAAAAAGRATAYMLLCQRTTGLLLSPLPSV